MAKSALMFRSTCGRGVCGGRNRGYLDVAYLVPFSSCSHARCSGLSERAAAVCLPCRRSVSSVLELVFKDSLGVHDSRALPDSNNEPTACFIESLDGRGGMAGIVCLPISRGSAIRSTKVMLSSSSSARLTLRPRGLRARTPAAAEFFAPRPAGATTRGGAPPTPPTSEARMSDHRRRFPPPCGASAPMRSRRSVISQLSHSPAASSSPCSTAGGRVAPSLRPPSFSAAMLTACAPSAGGLMQR
jgi:hypothetical protein